MEVNSNKGVLAAFLGTLAIITYREFKGPDASNWKIPLLPPPYKFTWAAVAFGILALVADIVSPKIATVIAVGLMIGVLFPVIQHPPGATNTGGNTNTFGGPNTGPPGTPSNPIGPGLPRTSGSAGG